jgi:hypothetical protein
MFKDMALGKVGGLEPMLHESWLMLYDSEEKCELPEDCSLHTGVVQIAAYRIIIHVVVHTCRPIH